MATESAIGTKIRTRRHQLDLTQQQLADRVGVDRASIGNWESGRHYPLRYVGKLESVLGISLSGSAVSDEEKIAAIEAEADALRALAKRMRAERLGTDRSDEPGQDAQAGLAC